MTPFLSIRNLPALALALGIGVILFPCFVAGGAQAQEETSRKSQREAENAAKRKSKEAARASKADQEEAKREKKLAKERARQEGTKESKRRAQIESGARTAIDWYGEALKLYEAGRYLDARGILLPLEDSARAVDIQEKVKLLIADTYFEQGGALNLAEALARYKSYLMFFPSSENAGYAQYQLGRSYFKQLGHPDRDQSFTDQAIFEYTKLIDNYPDSKYVEAARKDVLEAKARRAQHEFEVAQFYWDWNDKAAAARRLQLVLKERPELPVREKALWMCAQALYDTGQREEGDAYAARLVQDYPGSPYINRLNANSTGAVAKQVARERKSEKQAARTARTMAKQDRRRTRIVRKDSGLPADVPQTWDVSGSLVPVAAPPPSEEGKAAASGAPILSEKERQRQAAQHAQSAKLEAEEQEKAAKEAERAQKRQAEREREASKREEKERERAEQLAAETPQQREKREKAEAKAKAEVDRLEAEEQRRAEKQAAADAKRQAKQAAEDAKKARKKK